MKAREIRQMTTAEILQRIKEEEDNMSLMAFQLSTSQLTNTAKIQNTRRDIARMYTVLAERRRTEEQGA